MATCVPLGNEKMLTVSQAQASQRVATANYLPA
jgi:hypothetical protein